MGITEAECPDRGSAQLSHGCISAVTAKTRHVTQDCLLSSIHNSITCTYSCT